LASRGAARSERADVDTGEAHDQRRNGSDRRDGPILTASDLRWSFGGLFSVEGGEPSGGRRERQRSLVPREPDPRS